MKYGVSVGLWESGIATLASSCQASAFMHTMRDPPSRYAAQGFSLVIQWYGPVSGRFSQTLSKTSPQDPTYLHHGQCAFTSDVAVEYRKNKVIRTFRAINITEPLSTG
jgi:hypothetical protein